jgi:hypothetical protein
MAASPSLCGNGTAHGRAWLMQDASPPLHSVLAGFLLKPWKRQTAFEQGIPDEFDTKYARRKARIPGDSMSGKS